MKTKRGRRIKKADRFRVHSHAIGPSYIVDRATGAISHFKAFRGREYGNVTRAFAAAYVKAWWPAFKAARAKHETDAARRFEVQA